MIQLNDQTWNFDDKLKFKMYIACRFLLQNLIINLKNE